MFSLGTPKLQHPSQQQIELLHPFENLDADDLQLVSSKSLLQKFKKGNQIFKAGTSDSWTYFLLEGTLLLKDQAGNSFEILAGSPEARNALSHLHPRRYTGIAKSNVLCIKLDRSILKYIRPTQENKNAFQDRNVPKATFANNALFKRLYNDICNDKLQFPNITDLTERLQKILKSDDTNIEHITRIVQCDPILTARIIKTANGPLYFGQQEVNTCSKAILRLGIIPTKALALNYVLNDAIRLKLANPTLNQIAHDYWRHSVEVAAIAFVIAHITREFDPEQAMLAGLVHDIGAFPILYYAETHPELVESQNNISETIRQLRAEVGGLLLTKWNFPADLVTACREAENWSRNTAPEADICDIIIIAQLHSYIGSPQADTAPKLGQVVSLEKLKLGKLTPQHSLKVLDEARLQIDRARSLLAD